MLTRLRADIVFILIGAMPIIIAYLLRDTLTRDLSKDFGVVIISLALVDLLWLLVAGGEPLSKEIADLRDLNVLTRQAHLSGLVDVAARRNGLIEQNTSLTELIHSSRSNIAMSGYTLFRLKENPRIIQALAERARNGVRVRLLICVPDNTLLPSSVDESVLETMKSQMDATWNHLARTRDGLSEAGKKSFLIKRMHRKLLYTSILRFDDQINVLHYLRSKYTEETPTYVCRGVATPLFETYLAEFDYCFEEGEAHFDFDVKE
jgi:hypothetical protein